MTHPAYFNVHGQPLSVSARDAVLAREPLAYAINDRDYGWKVKRGTEKRGAHWNNPILGVGANEEAAWREALSRMRLQDEAEDARV